jgi:hypothetical protein
MIYQDKVYGTITINEPVLLALIASSAMQRLRGILQHGITGLIGMTTPITRFDHSLGALILVRQLDGSIEEQIAAMLHDVSHTAFSHVIDYVFDGHDSQSYHDEKKEEYVAQTDLPAILAAHGYDWHIFLQEENYPLLEQPSPRLCADRLDYFLRDSLDLWLGTQDDVALALANLVVADGRIATHSLATAQWLGYTFIQADDISWANWQEVGLYELTAQAIKRGLAVGAITDADIWGTDAPMWAKLHAHSDNDLQALLKLITPKTQFEWDDTTPTFRISTKLRSIDPDVVGDNGALRPLSSLDPGFAQHRADYLTRKAGKWPMRVISNQ